MTYHSELCRAMKELGELPNTVFMGQGVARHGGTTMSDTFLGVPEDKLLEMPVAEDMQLGMALGMAIEGVLPICIFPRWNFIECASNQLVNHLDRLVLYSDGGYHPRVIIRTAIPSYQPFDPGPQHDDDFTDSYRAKLRTVKVKRLEKAEDIVSAYRAAVEGTVSVVLAEYTERYKDVRAGGE